jgi:CubicO group peptidase (beta-lactamase class C family)
MELFIDKPMLAEPGARWRYNNADYILLGAIIEKVTGQSFFDYVKENIFKPAGMISTDYYELDRETPHLATGYTRHIFADVDNRADLEARKNNSLVAGVQGSPAGSCYSTIEDMLRFKIALFDHKLLNPEFTTLLVSGKVETGDGRKYGYVFFEKMVNGRRMVGHGGLIPGGDAQFEVYPELGYTVISLSNYDSQIVHLKLEEMITRR